jgi:hypothetical protein
MTPKELNRDIKALNKLRIVPLHTFGQMIEISIIANKL